MLPTARQNKTTPEILPSDRENIDFNFFLSEIDGGQKIFLLVPLFSEDCAWREDKSCRGLAKRLSTWGHKIVPLRAEPLGTKTECFTLEGMSKADCVGRFLQDLWHPRQPDQESGS